MSGLRTRHNILARKFTVPSGAQTCRPYEMCICSDNCVVLSERLTPDFTVKTNFAGDFSKHFNHFIKRSSDWNNRSNDLAKYPNDLQTFKSCLDKHLNDLQTFISGLHKHSDHLITLKNDLTKHANDLQTFANE